MTKPIAIEPLAALGACGLAAVWIALGCGISPIPEPPAGNGAAAGSGGTAGAAGSAGSAGSNGLAGSAGSAGSAGAPPSVDLQSVSAQPVDYNGVEIKVVGAPGAARPAGATVRIYDLDSSLPPAETQSGRDGSFSLVLRVADGDQLRLQIIAAATRSEPVDFVFSVIGQPPSPTLHALADCLILQPGLQADLSTTAAVHVENRCTQLVQIEAPRVRRDAPGLQVGSGGIWPAQIAPSASIDVPIVFHPSTGVDEEIVFIEASAPQRDRRPITVWGVSP
jgi:hypothetical protein